MLRTVKLMKWLERQEETELTKVTVFRQIRQLAILFSTEENNRLQEIKTDKLFSFLFKLKAKHRTCKQVFTFC